jgi:hypothetical protein
MPRPRQAQAFALPGRDPAEEYRHEESRDERCRQHAADRIVRSKAFIWQAIG